MVVMSIVIYIHPRPNNYPGWSDIKVTSFYCNLNCMYAAYVSHFYNSYVSLHFEDNKLLI